MEFKETYKFKIGKEVFEPFKKIEGLSSIIFSLTSQEKNFLTADTLLLTVEVRKASHPSVRNCSSAFLSREYNGVELFLSQCLKSIKSDL